MSNKPNPVVRLTQGPASMRYVALDPARYSPCYDSDCHCRMSPNNARGFGATEEEALSDFWDTYSVRVAVKGMRGLMPAVG